MSSARWRSCSRARVAKVAVLAGGRTRAGRLRFEAPSPSRAAALWASVQSSGRSGPAVPPWGLSDSPPKTPISLRLTTQELEPECKWPLLSAAWQVDSAALVVPRLAIPVAWEARRSVRAALRTPKARLSRPDRGGGTICVLQSAQVAHSAPFNAQAALLTTALGRGGGATARFEACRRVDPFRAAYYDHQMEARA